MEARFVVNITRDLEAISEELYKVYHRLCSGSGETQSTTMLDLVNASLKTETVADPESPKTMNNQRKRDSAIKILVEEDSNESGTDYITTNGHLLDVIRDLLKHLKKAVDNTCMLGRQKTLYTGKDCVSSAENHTKNTLKPEVLLSIREEQISNLRAVLNANKQTAEISVSNLKNQYENEKAIMTVAMIKLRRELNIIKQSKESFISLRCQFAERCDHFLKKLSELHLHLTDSEEEIKQLNLLMNEMDSQSLTE